MDMESITDLFVFDKEENFIEQLLFILFCVLFFIFPLSTALREVIGGLAIGIWLFSGKFIKNRERWLKQEWLIPVVLFMALPLLGLIRPEFRMVEIKYLKKSYYWILAFVIASIYLKKRNMKTMIHILLAGLSLNVFISMLQLLNLFPKHKDLGDYVSTGFMGHIDYSLFLVFGLLLLSFYFTRVSERKHKLGIIFLMAMYLLSLAFNIARSGYLAFAILCPVVFYNLLPKKHMLKVAFASVIVILLLFTSNVVQHRIIQAVNDIKGYYQGNNETSIGMRLYVWEKSIEIIKKNPIIGVGILGFKKNFVGEHEDPNSFVIDHPHNSYLYMATSFGLIGLGCFVWLLWVFIKKGWTYRNNTVGYAILSFALIFLIGSLTDSEIRSNAVLVMLALLTGIPPEDHTTRPSET